MDNVRLRFGIPDIELHCPDGDAINPSTFVGHQLVVLFLPTSEEAALRELGDYAARARHFSDADAWLLNVARDAAPSLRVRGGCHALATDPDDAAWRTFDALANGRRANPRSHGAVFLFSRGGGLQHAWFGAGNADKVVQELEEPSAW